MIDETQNFEQFFARTESANIIPVVKTLPADLLTPLAVYLKLSNRAENSFLLESVEGGENLARFSFIGANPAMIVSGDDDKISIRKSGTEEKLETSLFLFLRKHFARFKIAETEDLPSFVGGAIGYFGFSCARWFEKALRDNPV